MFKKTCIFFIIIATLFSYSLASEYQGLTTEELLEKKNNAYHEIELIDQELSNRTNSQLSSEETNNEFIISELFPDLEFAKYICKILKKDDINSKVSQKELNSITKLLLSTTEGDNIKNVTGISYLKHLCSLTLPLNGQYILTPELLQLPELTYLNFTDNAIEELPEWITSLTSLTVLYMQLPKVSELPTDMNKLNKLEELSLFSCNSLSQLPESISQLEHLKSLCLFECSGITELPKWIGDITTLETLQLGHTGIRSLPVSITKLTNLQNLIIQEYENMNMYIPDPIYNMNITNMYCTHF